MSDPQTPTPEPQPEPTPEPQPEPTPQPDQPRVDVTEAERPADTAGEEDHSDPNAFRGDDADAPADTGKPPQES